MKINRLEGQYLQISSFYQPEKLPRFNLSEHLLLSVFTPDDFQLIEGNSLFLLSMSI